MLKNILKMIVVYMLDKDKQHRDKSLISAEFGTRFRKLNTDNNKEESKR